MPALSTIVVVEDDEGMAQAIERILGAAGWRVEHFGSAEALLAAHCAHGADCLVLDLRLPGISGFELHRRLGEAGRLPPCIFITGHDEPALREQALQAGAAAYLPKPFPGRTLIGAVTRAMAAAGSG